MKPPTHIPPTLPPPTTTAPPVRPRLLRRTPTPAQIAASRANGAKSRGPVTPAGKAASCRNSTRHGLLANPTWLSAADAHALQQLRAGFIESFHPESADEYSLVESLVDARSRQLRL